MWIEWAFRSEDQPLHRPCQFVGEEESPEGGVVVADGKRELWLVEVTGEPLGERRSDPNRLLNDVGELGGMRGSKYETLRRLWMFFAKGLPGVDTDGGVRVRNVAVAVPDVMHFLKGLFIGGPVAPDFLANVLDAIAA